MDTRVALVGIVIENNESIAKMNSILSDFAPYVIGRMGIPYRERQISIISVVLDAPDNVISSLSGKIGMLDGITTKTVYSKVSKNQNQEKKEEN